MKIIERVIILAIAFAVGWFGYRGVHSIVSAQTPQINALLATSWNLYLPDREITPGMVDPKITLEVLKSKGWSTSQVRNVTNAEKIEVKEKYNLDPTHHGPLEIDHLISLELGGSNDIKNLWPELYDINVNGYNLGAHVKDHLENKLHSMVIKGQISLEQAQKEISEDWTKAYLKYVGPFPKYESHSKVSN